MTMHNAASIPATNAIALSSLIENELDIVYRGAKTRKYWYGRKPGSFVNR